MDKIIEARMHEFSQLHRFEIHRQKCFNLGVILRVAGLYSGSRCHGRKLFFAFGLKLRNSSS